MTTPGGAEQVRRGRRPLALGVLVAVLFVTFLDNTIVSVALGSVQTDFRAGVTALQWVVSAYVLTFAGAMLGFGMIGDEFGRKRVMLGGVGIFCAGSLLSALAPNAGVLIAGRAVMGLGAAASEPGTLSMLRHLYTDERTRSRAVGVWAGVSGLALAVGPLVGGILTGLWDWRAIFWFNVAFGLTALVAGTVVLAESSDPDAHRVDAVGAVLGMAALTALIFAVIGGEDSGFAAPKVIVLLALSAAAAAAFFWQESRAAHPLLDLRYLRLPSFLTANVVAFCTYFATFAVFFFTALYLAEVVGYSGYQIALVFLPMAVLMITASVLAGRWTTAVGPRWSIFIGCLLFGAGLLVTTQTLSPHPPYAPLALALALTGIGIGTTVVPITSSAMTAVPAERSGMAASATNTSREIGAVAGVAILGALINGQLHASLIGRLKELGIPAPFQAIVINGVETGAVPSSGNASGTGPPGQFKLVQEVIGAAYSAFYSGLHAALFVSGFLVLAAGAFAFVTLRGPRRSPRKTEPSPAGVRR